MGRSSAVTRRRRRPVSLAVLALAASLAGGCHRRSQPPPPPPHPYHHPEYARLSRTDLLVESQRKGVMGRRRSLEQIRRTAAEVGPLVADAVKQPAVAADLAALAAGAHKSPDAVREELRTFQEADLLLESGGDTNAVSPAAAVGVAQWLAGSAQGAGLHVDPKEYSRVVAQGRRVRSDLERIQGLPAEWSRPAQSGGPPLSRDQWIERRTAELQALEERRLAADERYDPRKAIFAQTRTLAADWRRFGRLDWALQAYHGGTRGVERTLAYYLAVPVGKMRGVPAPVSFEELYFAVSPHEHVPAFSYLYGRADDHRYYWWRVLMAQRALALYRKDANAFADEWASLAPGYPMDLAWYPELVAAPFADLGALQAAYRSGTLVPIPDDADRYGFAPRGIAPEDAANERWYRGLRPEALGMLIRVAASYREQGGKAPLRVTNAVTTLAYARIEKAKKAAAEAARQAAADAPAATTPADATPTRAPGATPVPAGSAPAQAEPAGAPQNTPAPPATSHMAGLSVDIASPADPWDHKVLEYVLGQLSDRMRIAWLRDPTTGEYHLCPNPAFRAEFVGH